MAESHEMNGIERVRRALLGQEVDRTPIYGWLSANLGEPINRVYGSLAALEEKYQFDIVHLFAGPGCFNTPLLDDIRAKNEEFTPDLLVDADIYTDPDIPEQYRGVSDLVNYYHGLGRFCYIQTPGFFENYNGVFGIQNQLMWLAEYPDELGALYARQAEWTIRFADHCIEAGVDMIHVSDDWGAQRGLMFSPALWRKIIKPNLKKVADHVHERGVFISLHSDGCIAPVTDDLAELGINCVHPWQETAGMSYDVYLEKYADRFAILGGLCVQSTIGFGDLERLEAEIRRVFRLLYGKRWVFCTTHFVQEHCSMEELAFAYDLIYRLARGEA